MAKITTQRNGWLIPGTDCGMMNSENAIRIKIESIAQFRKKVHADSNSSFFYNVEINGKLIYKYITKKDMDDDFERIEYIITNDVDEGRVF